MQVVDAGVLGRWLDANDAPSAGEEPVLELLSGGSQNTLYLIQRGDERMVLRMPGARADAARIDGLLREIRLVRALRGTDVPHAELIAANAVGDLVGNGEHEDTIAVFSHGGVINGLLHTILATEKILCFNVDYAGVTRLLSSRDGNLYVAAVNGTEHVWDLLPRNQRW